MLTITIKVNAPGWAAQGVKEHLAMLLEQLGYRDIRCTEVKVVRPEQMKLT